MRNTQGDEFEALSRLCDCWEALPPVVDDAYPEARRYYESVMKEFITALKANGRVAQQNISISQEISQSVVNELELAVVRFPPFHSAHEGYAVILEELHELWEGVRTKQSTAGRDERMRKEAIQVAAMAMRFIVDMKQFKN